MKYDNRQPGSILLESAQGGSKQQPGEGNGKFTKKVRVTCTNSTSNLKTNNSVFSSDFY